MSGDATGDLQWDITLENITDPNSDGYCTGEDLAGTLMFENDRVYFRGYYIGAIMSSDYYFAGYQDYTWGSDFISTYGGEVWSYYSMAAAYFDR
ncbi:MAG: hypothetical protein CL927_05895 [Deltaproteobacteria bacterium]|nr:hypothetical protein [Deltaproteobacteria bacterium]HCH65034.1 hypothetical protein [Deltaproteobacteria bacterium]